MKNIMLKSPVDKTSSEARRILSNKIFRKEVGNASALHPKRAGNGISQLHADSDACKGCTDTPKNATQGCSATLKLSKGSAKCPLRWRQMRTENLEKNAEPNDIQSLEYVRE
ncbi:MAG: hypothetical protein V1909_06555 [Candidatus Micrarchaeota archaeon]